MGTIHVVHALADGQTRSAERSPRTPLEDNSLRVSRNGPWLSDDLLEQSELSARTLSALVLD